MISHEFYLYFAQTKGNTIGWKVTFRKWKLIDNRPSQPALTFRRRCRNMMLLSPKPVLCQRSLNSLRKRRLAEEENRSLLLWETTVICVSNLVLRGIILQPRTCSSPQRRPAHCLKCVANCTCQSVGLPEEYCKPRISWTEFVVLVEGNSEPFISSIRLWQVPCFVLQMRRVKVKRDSSARFKRCLSTPVSLPNWIPVGRKIQKHVHCAWQCSWRRISSSLSRRT